MMVDAVAVAVVMIDFAVAAQLVAAVGFAVDVEMLEFVDVVVVVGTTSDSYLPK